MENKLQKIVKRNSNRSEGWIPLLATHLINQAYSLLRQKEKSKRSCKVLTPVYVKKARTLFSAPQRGLEPNDRLSGVRH